MVERAYLKCNYCRGAFDDEYAVNFKCAKEEGAFGAVAIARNKIIIKDKSSGLIPIIIANKKEKTSDILLDGIIDFGIGNFFCVSNEEIIGDLPEYFSFFNRTDGSTFKAHKN